MSNNIAGFILAAGEGRRLRPATLTRPKALVPFCGVPLLELVASYLNELGLKQTIVNASYQGERVFEACQRLNEAHGWNLHVSCEPKLLNQGGGIRYGVRLLPEVDTFLIHNVDILLDYDLHELIDQHFQNQADVTVLLIPGRGPRTVSLTGEGQINRFRDPEHGAYTFSGIHILNRKVLEFLDTEKEAPDIIDCYQRALDAGLKVQPVVANRNVYWTDIGTPRDYIRAHGEVADCSFRYHTMLRRAQGEQAARRFALELTGVKCTGCLGLGVELGVPSGSHLHNVVLWDYTRLPRPLLYADGIFVGNDVQPPKPVTENRLPDSRVFKALNMDENHYTIEELHKQGSGRRYCRLKSGDTNWVWCAYNPERRENASFAAISDFLDRLGINVPKVRLHLADTFELVSQDLGQSDLQLIPQQMREDLLLEAVQQIAILHVNGDKKAKMEELPLQPGFTKGLYDWERDYFRSNILERLFHAPEMWSDVAAEYVDMRTMLLSEPLVPLHRDFQSANIKVLNGKVYLIDFQGMRLGCAAYDLGSLLFDPYQCLPKRTRDSIWQEYCRQVRALGGNPPERKIFYIAACQRLMQCLGAYGKLWKLDGHEWYRQYIVPGFKMLSEAAAEADIFPALHAMALDGYERAQKLLK